MLRCIECVAEMETVLQAQQHCSPDREVIWKDGSKIHRTVVSIPTRRHTVVEVRNPNAIPLWKQLEKQSQ